MSTSLNDKLNSDLRHLNALELPGVMFALPNRRLGHFLGGTIKFLMVRDWPISMPVTRALCSFRIASSRKSIGVKEMREADVRACACVCVLAQLCAPY
jgi:hypothetical protein